jgi:hypothetical protein
LVKNLEIKKSNISGFDFSFSVSAGFHGGTPSREVRRARTVVALLRRRCQDESFPGN